jgi:hypothetical protein
MVCFFSIAFFWLNFDCWFWLSVDLFGFLVCVCVLREREDCLVKHETVTWCWKNNPNLNLVAHFFFFLRILFRHLFLSFAFFCC